MNFSNQIIKVFPCAYEKDNLSGDYLRCSLLPKYFKNVITEGDNIEPQTVFFRKRKAHDFILKLLKINKNNLILDICDPFEYNGYSMDNVYECANLITTSSEHLREYFLTYYCEKFGYKKIEVAYDICEYNFIKDFVTTGDKVFVFGSVRNVSFFQKYKDKFNDCVILINRGKSYKRYLDEINSLNFLVKRWNWQTLLQDAYGCRCSALVYDPSVIKYKTCNRILLSLWLGLPVLTEKYPQAEYFLKEFPDFVKDINEYSSDSFKQNIDQRELRDISINCKYGYKQALKSWEKILVSRDNSTKRKAIYTVVVGKTYPLRPSPSYDGWDKIAFVDDLNINPQGWILKKFEAPEEVKKLSSRKRSRYPKMMPHLYLKDYDISLYIDNRVDLFKDPSIAIQEHPNENWIGMLHPHRVSVEQEFKRCLELRYISEKILNELKKQYEISNFHEINPLSENGFILRHHNDPDIINLDSLWWDTYKSYENERDQLILPLVFWKTLTQIQLLNKSYLRCVYHDYNTQYSPFKHELATAVRAKKMMEKSIKEKDLP